MRLNDHLMREVKRYAAERQVTITLVLEEALRELLARKAEARERQPVRLPTFKGEGLQPGVDLNDSAALLELMADASG